MSQYAQICPKLTYFFSAYFPQDWTSFYAARGGEPLFYAVVRDFLENNPRETIVLASEELEKLLAKDLSEAMLREVIVHQLGANVYPPGYDQTYRQWAEAVFELLRNAVS